MADKGRLRALRERLWRQDPRCHWCGVVTVPPEGSPSGFAPNTATIDHLRSRFDSTRTKPNGGGETRRVLSCMKCNGERAAKEQSGYHAENGTSKRPKGDGDAAGWCANFVELRTRPLLVEELKVNERLRKRLFFAFNVMANAAAIRDVDVATHALAVLADYHWKLLDGDYQEHLTAKGFALYNQFVSTFKNYRLNMGRRTKPRDKWRAVNKPFYVLRD